MTLATDPYAGTPEEFTEGMWKEYAANWRSGGESVFNKRSGESALTGHIPATAIKAAMRFALGYEQVVQTAGTGKSAGKTLHVLRRKNPIRHPYYENLWCTGVGELEFKPISAYMPGIGEKLKVPTRPVAPKSPAALSNRTGYKKAKLTLRFGPLPYDLYEDDATVDAFGATYTSLSDSGGEFLRNVQVDTEPRTETFETKVTWKYAEGAGLDPTKFTSPKGQTALADRAQILVKPDVVFRWYDVPQDWLVLPGGFLPDNLLAALGCVNRGSNFYGARDGTLLLVGAKLTRHPWTLRPDRGFRGAETESKFLCDVELLCSYFDPVKGFTSNPAVQITAFRGHNNFPYRGSTVALAGGSDGNGNKWFLASIDGTESGARLYRRVFFEQIFDSPRNGVIVPSDS